ncbi:MAG: glycoside hydrolase family 43 protein [Calditrichaceae bacterium]
MYTMKLVISVVFITILGLTIVHTAENQMDKSNNNAPIFTKAVYQGDDQIYKDYPLEDGEFYNPILQGCYPDPAVTKKGDDYYLVCSSFAMFPGVPIFHSKDLVNWTQIGHVLDRTSQLDVHDTGISGGVYAPGITYNPGNDTFYMIVTAFAGGLGNIIVKTKDPMKGWSEPIKLKFNGIDPSIFFDDDGKAYIVHNDAPDKGKELYNGHRVIKIWEYDIEKDQVIEGTDQIVVDGGVDISQKPIWIEAPHLYKKNGQYYLMCAEGGTGDWHSEVIFISDSPIADGKYYGVFLAIRPNEQDRVNIGRETFILPVDWSGTFPFFENGLIPIGPKLKVPAGVTNKNGKDGYFPNGNFIFEDDFSSDKLDYSWIGLRGPKEAFISRTDKGLQITPFEANIKELKPTSTLFRRQQHNNFSFTTTLMYKPGSEKDLAGLTCLQNESSNYVFGITKKGSEYILLLERNKRKGRFGREVISEIVASVKIDIEKPVSLKVSAEGDNYQFSYSVGGEEFVNLGGTVSGDILSTNVAGGFTGALIGLYATSGNNSFPE